MKGIITITTEQDLNNLGSSTDGFYDIQKHGESFVFDGKRYEYHNSGLARCVYRSECGEWVIKVPYVDMFSKDDLADWLNERTWKFAHPSVHHNYYEALAYEKCPKRYKGMLAKTELLKNCWVRQEFVEVLDCSDFTNRHDFREIGKREDGSFCVFDYDPLLSNFVFNGCDWQRINGIVKKIESAILA